MGQDALVSVFKVLNMAATGSKATSRRSNALDLVGSLDLSLKTFDVAITASGLTRGRQLPSVCTVRSLLNQPMFYSIWIFLNKYNPPTPQTMSQITSAST